MHDEDGGKKGTKASSILGERHQRMPNLTNQEVVMQHAKRHRKINIKVSS